MRKYGWLLWATLPLLIVAGVWWLIQRPAVSTQAGNDSVDTQQSEPPTRTELAGLQRQADAACRCDRTQDRPWTNRCWAEYRQSAARFLKTDEWATACMEESVAVECFGTDGANQLCVSTQREHGACSDAERRTRMAETRRRNAGGCGG